MSVERPPVAGQTEYKHWAERLNSFLTRTKSHLAFYVSGATAYRDGMLVWDDNNKTILYSGNGQWNTIGNGVAGADGTDGTDGTGFTGGSYDSNTGIITFTSNDGLGFSTADVRGSNGTDGDGFTGGSYNASTGIVTFTSDDGLGFSTTDIRGTNGTDGDGFTGGSYNASTGVVTFTSDDGLGFSTGDLRGADVDYTQVSALYHNGNIKAEATADGVTVTGDVEATEFIGDLRGAVVFKAQAGEALTKGDVVYISGISGNTTVVSKADADDAAKMPAFGLAATDANNNANLEVYTFGTLSGLDTSSYTEGDELFVGTTAGALVSTAPAGEGSLVQKVGKVTRSHASAGSIKIMGAGRTNATPNLNDGNIFIGDSNNQAITASLATQVSTLEVNDLSTAVTWANVPDANITQTSVTQHQTALSITESQISDFGTYLTAHQDISGKANLSGADFTGDVSVAGTFNTDGIEATLNNVDYDIINTDFFAPIFPVMRLGGTSAGNKVHTIEMRPAAGGVRMHWHQTTDNIAGQTLRFHTTDRGVHVGDDRTGTYTAGDVQNNADLDFGMLVGRQSSNLGSNNFGFGYNIGFSVGTASNMGVGSVIRVLGQAVNATTNSVAFGGNLRLGRYTAGGEVGATSSLVGGEIARTGGAYSFTWGKGELDQYGQYPTNNEGNGCVLFGHVTEIDSNSNWSMAGGDLDGNQKTSLEYATACIGWGKGVEVEHSIGSVVFGQQNKAYFSSASVTGGRQNYNYAPWTVLGGYSNTLGYVNASVNTGKYSACFGANNLVEGDANFVSGQNNNTLGDSGACIGRGLKTPLFQPNGGGDYVWDDHSVVVGGYNAEATKYYTNTANTAWVEDHRFVVGTGTSSTAKRNGFIVARPTGNLVTPAFCGIIMPALASSTSYASATAAKAGGVPVGGLYRIGSDVKILLSTD